jgi:hypothetical protein
MSCAQAGWLEASITATASGLAAMRSEREETLVM